jgi:hypothetical protein
MPRGDALAVTGERRGLPVELSSDALNTAVAELTLIRVRRMYFADVPSCVASPEAISVSPTGFKLSCAAGAARLREQRHAGCRAYRWTATRDLQPA